MKLRMLALAGVFVSFGLTSCNSYIPKELTSKAKEWVTIIDAKYVSSSNQINAVITGTFENKSGNTISPLEIEFSIFKDETKTEEIVKASNSWLNVDNGVTVDINAKSIDLSEIEGITPGKIDEKLISFTVVGYIF